MNKSDSSTYISNPPPKEDLQRPSSFSPFLTTDAIRKQIQNLSGLVEQLKNIYYYLFVLHSCVRSSVSLSITCCLTDLFPFEEHLIDTKNLNQDSCRVSATLCPELSTFWLWYIPNQWFNCLIVDSRGKAKVSNHINTFAFVRLSALNLR